MNLDRVTTGKNVPNEFNVIIEIPSHSDPVKYEVDKETGAMFVDRFIGTAMVYPCNYGYVPHTLSDDGDAVDVLVVTPLPLQFGSVIQCRPIGMLQMEDEAGADAKVLAVPIDKLTGMYSKVSSFRDMPSTLLDTIAHFFEHYKDLEPGKWVKITGWVGVEESKKEIMESIERFQKAPEKPCF
ncbi:MAG: inorganic diphosphatase [Gammaproteobacteria bacterium]|jgi:inorganic pyrophosphatase|nr:inorganic diphosphatase [Gammaproteobacteria bacterium]